MTYRSVGNLLIAICGSLLATSCTYMQIRVDEPNVTIERMTTPSGQITYAHFYKYRNAYLLRGTIRPATYTKWSMGGHVAAAVTAPDGANTECTSVVQDIRGRTWSKPFSIPFDELPAPGSVVQVKHHDSAKHDGCEA